MGKDTLNFFPEINLYSLNNPGIPFLTKGEKPVISDLAMKKLAGEAGAVERIRFSNLPISNMAYHLIDGNWVNASWIMDIKNFDTGVFDLLRQPQSTLVRLFELDERLAQMSGCRQMAEIGFNVGGGEIVFKRILLPENYRQPEDWPVETVVYQGTKMPDVFVEAWNKLKVDDYDPAWDLRVREQLAGNCRDMNKQIVYQMINGEKLVEWNGVKMWAGLLSDRRDIDRYLAEEAALATLKPGEFLAAKYSHGGGGAISAATSQERDMEKPVIVGDVQMMGENGEIYQAAVEGEAHQIDAMIDGLVFQLHLDHNLSMPGTGLSLRPWLKSLPVLPLAMYPMKFLLEEQLTAGVEPVKTVTENPIRQGFEAVTTTVFAGEIIQPARLLIDDDYQIAGGTVFEANSDLAGWWVSDADSDGDDGGGGSDRPEVPVPGGGLTIKPVTLLYSDRHTKGLPLLTSGSDFEIPTRLDLVGIKGIDHVEPIAEQEPESIPSKTKLSAEQKVVFNDTTTRTVLVGQEAEPLEKFTKPTIEGSTIQEEIVFKNSFTLLDDRTKKRETLITTPVETVVKPKPEKQGVVEIPIYQPTWQPVAIKEIPEWVWQGTAAIPDEIIDWPWFLVTMFYALLNTKVLLKEEARENFSLNQGSGFSFLEEKVN